MAGRLTPVLRDWGGIDRAGAAAGDLGRVSAEEGRLAQGPRFPVLY